MTDFQYAGLDKRFIALVFDFIMLSLFFFPVTRIVKGVWIMSTGEHLWTFGWFITDPLCIAFLVVIVLYFIILEGLVGATIGKRLAGIRVVGLDGRHPGLIPATIRNLLRLVDTLPVLNILGIILIVTSHERARFGDRVADTRVIIDSRKRYT